MYFVLRSILEELLGYYVKTFGEGLLVCVFIVQTEAGSILQ
jgi:hypothetical protein